MKEFKRRVLNIKFDGESYELRFPSNRVLNDFVKAEKDKPEDEALEGLIRFLDGLGLPEDIAWDMEPYMLGEIMEEFKSKKK